MIRKLAQEKEIASILNTNPSDRGKIAELLSEYFDEEDQEAEIGSTASESSESSDEDLDSMQLALDAMQTSHLDLCVDTENLNTNKDDEDYQKIKDFK